MKWNQEIFNKNIEHLIKTKCDGVQNRFNDKLGRDSATRWKKSRPSLENLLSITEEFDCSMDWLLTGTEKTNKDCEINCSGEVRVLCEKVKEVIESGTHWASSLESNIHSFKAGLDNDKTMEEMKKTLERIEKQASLKLHTDTS